MKRVTCLFSTDTHKRLKGLAVERDTTLIVLINEAVKLYLHQLDQSHKRLID